ncbi:MAG: cation:proton antiporter [Deltaproteobacteria bacterium]|nr:cation:proton antiporter [Deltaproteobacteria bacterium]
MEGHLFQFALLFGVLGLAAAVSLSVRLPVVPLYIAAGVVLGVFLEPDEVVGFLGKLGVVFLLFSMGLEFSIPAPRDAGKFVAAGAIDWAFNFPVGLIAGLALGWSWQDSVFLAGILYMSSSAVVAKCIVDFGRAARPETETVLGIMVFEDLVIAFYLVLINTLIVTPSDEGPAAYLFALVRAAAFIALLIALARRFGKPLARLLAHRSEEGFTLVLFSFVLLVASAAEGAAGLSEAVGAFLAGLVIGSTGLKERASSTLLPFQTLFAALFFVSFGMSLDLRSMPDVALPGLVLVIVGVGSKIAGGYLAGRVAGHPPPLSAVVGLSLVPKGEFSVLIAALAASISSGHTHLAALTGLYVFALSIIGPIGMREADRIADLLRRRITPATERPTPGE